ncbi:hypothetical protein [Polaribacter sp. Q13]|uniref:hypothetical protein n=1 Tax=Polaribacter sp. Q13 TaxID=2806551 RepID=UPI0034A4B042
MTNKGVDFTLNAAVVDSNDFSYNTTFNFSYNKNEVTKVDVPSGSINNVLTFRSPVEGNPLNYLYSFNYAGLDENGNPTAFNENGELINVDGEKSVNGVLENAEIDTIDALIFEGTTTPKYYGAWINNFTYKNFYLKALTTFKLGHVFRNTDVMSYSSLGSSSQIHKDFENRWKNPGDEANTIVPRVPDGSFDIFNPGYRYYNQGNQFVDSASHIRIKELVIGYNLDSKLLSEIGIDKLGLSLQARNLGVITFNK